MSDRFDGVLVPAFSPEIVKAFQTFRPEVPLRMSVLEQRLVAITRYKSGYYKSDYEQLARQLCALARVAVIMHFSDEGGSLYQVLDRSGRQRSFGPTWETGEDTSEVDELLKVGFDEIESLLRGGCGELVCVNIPLLSDAMHRLQTEDFIERYTSYTRQRATLISQAETVDRLLAQGNFVAAEKLLTAIRHQLPEVLTRSATYWPVEIIDAKLEQL